MNIAIIPARGGSKRIPRKNIKTFFGKPMIAWSIEAAIKSRCFDAVLVSTDDEEIATVAKKFGASVPFLRPASLSDDHTGTTKVISHAIEWHLERGITPELVCCLYATAPLISSDDIKLGKDLLTESDADFSFPVTSFGFPIQRATRIKQDGRLEMIQPEHYRTRSQDLEPAFHDAGQFYWGKTTAWLEGKPLFSSKSIPLILPRFRVQDIDTVEDWERAELIAKCLQH